MANAKVLPFFIAFYCVLVIALAAGRLVCLPRYCQDYNCPEVPANCKGPDHEIGKGGFCNCCNVCITLLGKGDECYSLHIIGNQPPSTRCKDGLVCVNSTCQVSHS